MPSNRCTICDVEWPRREPYGTCPQCDEETFSNPRGKPDPAYRALALAAGVLDTSAALTPQQEELVTHFRRWLDTVTADDFAATIP